MKVALCFLISYKHVVNKENIWRKWIEPNKDITNIYFHYKDLDKIQSPWIKKHCIPRENIVETSYYHVVGAYISLLKHAYRHDNCENKWFIFLTDSCVPIVSPEKFRKIFFEYFDKTIMKWQQCWWNINYHRRANLRLFPESLRLGHDPWFIICREDVKLVFDYLVYCNKEFNVICSGGLANESIFAMILKMKKTLEKVVNKSVNLTNWEKMSSPTSPYVFKYGSCEEIEYIKDNLEKNELLMFLRKVDISFPDDILSDIISKNNYLTEIKKDKSIIIFVLLIIFLFFIYFFVKILN